MFSLLPQDLSRVDGTSRVTWQSRSQARSLQQAGTIATAVAPAPPPPPAQAVPTVAPPTPPPLLPIAQPPVAIPAGPPPAAPAPASTPASGLMPPQPAPPPVQPIIPGSCTSGVFVNEVHYRNAGDDVNEFVELGGPAGTSVQGFQIVVYDTNAIATSIVPISSTEPLTGVLGGLLGVLLVDFEALGVALENGGVALSDADGVPCDFVAFNRDLTSGSDVLDPVSRDVIFPAGVRGFDIGFREAVDASATGSIGRSDDGTGTPVWATFDTASPGEINPGQIAAPIVPGS